jgi:hypothetical protein
VGHLHLGHVEPQRNTLPFRHGLGEFLACIAFTCLMLYRSVAVVAQGP